MRFIAVATIVLAFVTGTLGMVATLRAMLIAGFLAGYGFGRDTVLIVHSPANLLALLAITVLLLAGAMLLSRRRIAGRTLILAGCAGAIVLSVIEIAVWAALEGPTEWSDEGGLGLHRWLWFGLTTVTLVLAALPATKQWCTTTEPAGRPADRTLTLVTAGTSLATAVYHLWRAKEQSDFGWHHITVTLLPFNASSVFAGALLEPLVASIAAAVTLSLGALLMVAGNAAGRFAVIAGCAITLAQAVFGWTDLARLYTDLGAADLLTIFAPSTAPIVALTLTVPAVTAVLALTAPPSNSFRSA